MMNMIERVARAIAQADEQNGGPPYEYRISQGKHAKAQLFDQARAAIEAMMEPTDAMKADGRKVMLDDYEDVPAVRSIYQAMITAALEE